MHKSGGAHKADYLAHRVSRRPGDLMAHARRVLLRVQRGEAEATFGALLDAFIVLGANGRAFRQRMLGVSVRLIDADGTARSLSELDSEPTLAGHWIPE